MPEHPRSEEYFIKDRKEIYNFVRTLRTSIANKKRLLLIIAEVKAGKREITELIKLKTPEKKAYYLTSLNRKDVRNQKDELEAYGIETYIVNRDAVIEQIVKDVNEHIAAGTEVMFFWDECDYGSGKKQMLAKLFEKFVDVPQVTHILISATAHETMFSTLASREDFEKLVFVPPAEYKGARYFLENNLIFSPKAFLERKEPGGSALKFTAHAYEVMRDSFTEARNIGGVRVTGRGITTEMIEAQRIELEAAVNQHFATGFHGRPFKIKVIDAVNGLNWEDSITRRGYTCAPLEANWLFIFNQTCTRGTDLKWWHPNLAFWHDARTVRQCYLNTLLQAILRPSHYSSCYTKKIVVGGKEKTVNVPQPIRLYVDKAAVKAATGDFSDHAKEKGKAPARMTKARNGAQYESYESTDWDALKVHFDAAGQAFPALSSFPKGTAGGGGGAGAAGAAQFYMPLKPLGINEEDRARKVWDYESAKRLRFQENRRHHYYVVPSYRDLSDPSSLVFVITRKLSKQEADKKPFKATSKSMYEG